MPFRVVIEKTSFLIHKILTKLDVLVEDNSKIVPLLTAGYIKAGKDGIKIPLRKTVKDGITYWRPLTNFVGIPACLLSSARVKPYVVINEMVGALPILDQNSDFLTQWSIVILMSLAFTSIITPYEATFITTDKIDGLFLINRFMDLIFLFDISIQFLTAYTDPKTDKLIRNHKKIMVRYLSTWFFLDLISTIPFEMAGMIFSTDSTDVALLQVLRLLRLARLLKLLRLLRANRKIKQLRLKSNIKNDTMQLALFILCGLVFSHWFGCGYRFFGDINGRGWVETYKKLHVDFSPFHLYVASLYWGMCNLALQAAGGALTPDTDLEFVYSILVKFISLGYVVMTVSTLSASFVYRKKDDVSHEIKLDGYRSMFKTLRLNKRHQTRVNVYWTEFRTVAHIIEFDHYLSALPDHTRSLISLELFAPNLKNVPYLENHILVDVSLLLELCLTMKIKAYSPNDAVFLNGPDGIYFIQKGIVGWDEHVFLSGDPFGRDCLRSQMPKTRGHCLTFVTTYLLPRDDLEACISRRPWIAEEAKKWTVKRALQKYVKCYKRLYHMYCKRGARMVPPIVSRRPNVDPDDFDQIDEMVIQHMIDSGY